MSAHITFTFALIDAGISCLHRSRTAELPLQPAPAIPRARFAVFYKPPSSDGATAIGRDLSPERGGGAAAVTV